MMSVKDRTVPVCEYRRCDEDGQFIARFLKVKRGKVRTEYRFFSCLKHFEIENRKLFAYHHTNRHFPRTNPIPEAYLKPFDAEIEKIKVEENDVLIYRSNEKFTNYGVLEHFTEHLRRELNWKGLLIVLKKEEKIEALNENICRQLYDILKARFGSTD